MCTFIVAKIMTGIEKNSTLARLKSVSSVFLTNIALVS